MKQGWTCAGYACEFNGGGDSRPRVMNEAPACVSFVGLPPLAYLLANQMESRKNIARHLGVGLRTLQRYQSSGNAPRASGPARRL